MGVISDLFGGDETTNVNETTNISPASASQSGEGNSASVITEGDVTIVNEEVGDDVIEAGGRIVDDSLKFAGDANDSANNLIRDALNAGGDFVNNIANQVFGLAGDSVAASRDAAREASRAAEKVTGEALDFGRDSLDVVSDAFQENAYITESVIGLSEGIALQSGEILASGLDSVVQTVGDLNESRAIETQENLKAIQELGQVVATGGESLQTSVNKAIGIGAVLVLGVVAWQAVRSA